MNIRVKKMNEEQIEYKRQLDWKPQSSLIPKKLGFLTPTVMNVLEFFLTDPMKEYYGREVSRKTGVSLGSANRILRLLTDVDFLTQERKGKMIIYRLNLKEPVVKQFKILINVFSLKELVSELKLGSQRVVLFGSCSQGTDTKESDIDLFIITIEKERIRKIVNVFNRKLQRHIAPIIVDMNEFIRLKKEDKPLYENIERGSVLWEAE
jgi:predicted nucleotidyltransferase